LCLLGQQAGHHYDYPTISAMYQSGKPHETHRDPLIQTLCEFSNYFIIPKKERPKAAQGRLLMKLRNLEGAFGL
jgi:hypothetical protein